MREIKFRAWDKDKKQMVLLESRYVSEALHYHEKGTHTLMQFTGLKDKNGKEIFESDIVQQYHMDKEYSGQKYEVVFHDGCFLCKFWNDNAYQFRITSTMHLEVIGNIYEDRHLLNNK